MSDNIADMIKNLTFCVFDLETTGGNQKSDKIIEIGLVRIKNLEIVEKKTILIDPEIKIPEFIQRLTSISQQDVQGRPLIEDVIDDILSFMGDAVLVAHNASFDVPFFNSVLQRLGKKELKNNSICTNLMTKYLIPNLMNSNLNYMSKIFEIGHSRAHRALDDAMATAELLIIYLRIFLEKGIQKINHLYYPRNRYELDRVHFKSEDFNSEEIVDLIQRQTSCSLATFKGENGVILFALPIEGKPEEIDCLKRKLNELPWKILTIKLVGPFFEGLIALNQVFNKIEDSFKVELIDLLEKSHLSHLPKVEPTEFEELGDFIIIEHLVPEQLTIYPLHGLHIKSRLVFRYPGHQKKLIQFINSRASRMSGQKGKKTPFHPMIKEFVDRYLIALRKNDSAMIFGRKLVEKSSESFFQELDRFLLKNPNPYHYPRNHI